MSVLIMVDIMPFELVDDPRPSIENDVSGFTWCSASASELNICGVTS